MSYSFAQKSFERGQRILQHRSSRLRKANGQFLTPPRLAHFMAQQLGDIRDGDHVLDPALGSGVLLCALIDRLIATGDPVEIWMDGFELDEPLYSTAKVVLDEAIDLASTRGIRIHLNLFQIDFVLNGLNHLRPSLLETPAGQSSYHHIIANPPYFKINLADPRRQAAEGVISGHTNIYTLFMGLAARMLERGSASFIVPRSFCSGAYFARFRREFLQLAAPQKVHLFESRSDAFGRDEILQENIVLSFGPVSGSRIASPVQISTSQTVVSLLNDLVTRAVSCDHFVSKDGVFRLPTSQLDEDILDIVDQWQETLHSYGMAVSTGPVVPFRAAEYLRDIEHRNYAPLLWMQHIRPQQITWPLKVFRKSQYLAHIPETEALLVDNHNYVLLRRFSAKEEHRRLVAAPYLAREFPYPMIGLENHLNYIYRPRNRLSEIEAIGLSGLLNSRLIDRYFRISNGSTQINATELRTLPLPPLDVVRAIGQALAIRLTDDDLDFVVMETLKSCSEIPDAFPILRETRAI